ncbi:MAG: E3 binding domain-containing protein, partial [Petrimonas sp.]|nr:E3 binding domain-containing protein [Petrimonas sp.]
MKETKLRATPAARALARRLGVDLFNVTGTGYKGRIHKDDIAGFNYEEKVHISPLARRVADEHNIDLTNVKGSGHQGKVMKDDVLKLISDPALKAQLTRDDFADIQQAAKPAPPVPKKEEQGQSPQAGVTAEPVVQGETETVQLSQMRKIIAKRMSESFYSAPWFIQT